MEGKECSKFLELLDELEAVLPGNLLPYIDYFRCLLAVIKSTFGINVKESWTADIAACKASFNRLQEISKISETPKLHIIFNHISDYIQLTGKGLGEGSEQALEASHHAFKKIWMRYWVRDPQNPTYLKNYLEAVIMYNWLHM